jgi:hypothetical protein
MNYGLISHLDAEILEKTLGLICRDFPEVINYCEIGLYNGRTANGVKEFLESKGRQCVITGIESFADNEKLVYFPEGANLIAGNSSEVYNLLDDESQHLILIDGNHNFPSVIADFFCYTDKVKDHGYLMFHDTGEHIKPLKDYQGMGSLKDPDMFISVRRALKKIGLLDNKYPGWKLIFDEADPNDPAGGFCCFKKIKI